MSLSLAHLVAASLLCVAAAQAQNPAGTAERRKSADTVLLSSVSPTGRALVVLTADDTSSFEVVARSVRRNALGQLEFETPAQIIFGALWARLAAVATPLTPTSETGRLFLALTTPSGGQRLETGSDQLELTWDPREQKLYLVGGEMRVQDRYLKIP
jgi:hypothetical protein